MKLSAPISRRVFAGGVAMAALLRAIPLAASQATIRLAVADRAAPIAYRRDDGVVSGIIVDLVKVVGAQAGWTIEAEAYPWTRAQALIRADETDAICSLATEERRGHILFAPEPLFQVNAGLIHFSPDNPRRSELSRIGSLEDLRNFRIVGALGDSWPNGLFAGWPNFLEVPDIGTSLKLVASLRADLVLDSPEVVKYFRKQYALPMFESIDASFLPGSMSLYQFGIRRSFPKVATLIGDFAAAQAKAQASGALAEALKPYLS